MSPKLHDCCATTFGQALIGAVVFWAALPPLDLWPLAWIAPVCWILLIRRQQLPGSRPYLALWLVGFLFWLAAVHWVRLAHWTAYFGWVALAFYLAFYLPVFVGLTRVAVHQLRVPVILAAPMVWTGLELARGHFLTGFTMASLCHTQYRWIALIQLSDLAGGYGVSFVMMLTAACLARMIPCREGPGGRGQGSGVRGQGPGARGQGRGATGQGRGARGEGWRLQSPLPFEGPEARGQGTGVSGQGSGVRGQATGAGKHGRWSVWPLLPAAAVVGTALLYGHFRVFAEDTSQDARPKSRIALIQGSVDTEIKFDPEMRQRVFREYYQLSQEALAKSRSQGQNPSPPAHLPASGARGEGSQALAKSLSQEPSQDPSPPAPLPASGARGEGLAVGTKSESAQVDLIVWPETMFRDTVATFDQDARMPQDFEGTQQEFREDLRAYCAQVDGLIADLARTLDVPLLLGVDRHHYGPEGIQRFNSALYVARDGRWLGHYDKVHLVVFGEYVPFVRHFPWLQRLTPVSISISPGSRPTVFRLDDGLRIAPNICYETVIPHVIRRQVNALKAADAEPDVLVNLTNDGWFRGSSELDMHLACGVFRAVECRKPLLIAANTGFSAFIDGDGKIRAQGRRRETDTILADVAPDPRSSCYLTYGDWPAGICLAGCVVFGLAGAWGRLRRKAAGGRGRGGERGDGVRG